MSGNLYYYIDLTHRLNQNKKDNFYSNCFPQLKPQSKVEKPLKCSD